MVVTGFSGRSHGAQHQARFAWNSEQKAGGNDVPHVLRDYISGEEIDLVESVILGEEIGLELAVVSGAGAVGGRFDPFGRCRSLRAG